VTIASGRCPCYEGFGRQYLLPETAKKSDGSCISVERLGTSGRRLGATPGIPGRRTGPDSQRATSALPWTAGSTAPQRPKVTLCAGRSCIGSQGRTSWLSMRFCTHQKLLAGSCSTFRRSGVPKRQKVDLSSQLLCNLRRSRSLLPRCLPRLADNGDRSGAWNEGRFLARRPLDCQESSGGPGHHPFPWSPSDLSGCDAYSITEHPASELPFDDDRVANLRRITESDENPHHHSLVLSNASGLWQATEPHTHCTGSPGRHRSPRTHPGLPPHAPPPHLPSCSPGRRRLESQHRHKPGRCSCH
jgi:hypothetical protein